MDQEPVVLKEASCPSLSHQSQLEYAVGKDQQGIHLRLTGNSGNGNFNGYWVQLPDILAVLNDHDGPFIWSVLCPIFDGRSVNSSAFLMAALKNEGLVRQSEKESRRHECCDPKAFMAKVQAMMAPKPTKPKKGGKPVTIDPPADFEAPTVEAKS